MKNLKHVLSLWLGLAIQLAYANEVMNSSPKEMVELVAGLPKPPFIIDENGNGMQLELIRQAFDVSDIDVSFIHMPLGRNIMGYRHENVDGIAILPPEYDHPTIYLSEPYITYQNVAISLLEHNFTIEKIADLSGKSVVSFQNAKKFLGDEFGKTVSYLVDYREIHDQKKQIDLLFLRRAEVIVLDINIFRYMLKHHSEQYVMKPFKIHYIFNKRDYAVGFKSAELRDKFNYGLQITKDNGSYQMVLDNYLYQSM
ncbi:substrate-binding periplasmic protein [Thalassotalea marina]|uniref:Uncharacterized protein n=1 Tax=Thalassotalea marina TaxID=1673741 RepID=A0A919ELS3_9GAMM|nr:transporter substrate-binding domain-containing protein [Thalassotalea marina]GHF97593.1 hypothetical protein GCM10017161_27240 [Thalassotalea marina]